VKRAVRSTAPSVPRVYSWPAAELARAANVTVGELDEILAIVSRTSGAVFEWSADRRTVRGWGLEPLMGLAPAPPAPWERAGEPITKRKR